MTNDGKEFEFGTSVHDKAKYIESLFKNGTTLDVFSVQEGDGVRIQTLADRFAIPNDSMREILMWHEGELHEYGTKLQGKILDLKYEVKEYKQLYEEYKGRYEYAIIDGTDLRQKLEQQEELLNKEIGHACALEEWLTEYRDQLKKENAYHKNQGIINAINELLNETSTDI